MSKIEIFSADQREQWLEITGRFPESLQDIYFTPLYGALEETVQEGGARCFYYAEGQDIGVVAFFLRPIDNTGFFDAESFYGYGGPLVNSHRQEFLNSFEEAWLDYCRQNRIIAEFWRFHCLISNQAVFQKNIRVVKNRTTVVVDLTRDDLWGGSLSGKNRNMIRKAEKSGVRLEKMDPREGIDRFIPVYRKTMDGLGAEQYFYFSDRYFKILKELGEGLVVLGALVDGELAAASLFLRWKQYFHYHLSGNLPEYRSLAPTNLILWAAIQEARAAGCRAMHLGGGRTDSPEDSLFKFKRSFSGQTLDYYIGMRVHDDRVYRELISDWQRRNPGKKQELFLQYRY